MAGFRKQPFFQPDVRVFFASDSLTDRPGVDRVDPVEVQGFPLDCGVDGNAATPSNKREFALERALKQLVNRTDSAPIYEEVHLLAEFPFSSRADESEQTVLAAKLIPAPDFSAVQGVD